jgi:hypothetical protein
VIVDFSAIDLKEGPTLILRAADGTPIGSLGYAFNVSAELCYNEISKLTFTLPAFVDGQKTPHYDNATSLRVVNLKGVGQFIPNNPKVVNDGIREVKECVAYSLEHEFTAKKITLENSTYNFWNPVATDGTILGYILEKMPAWTPGSIDASLMGKYRTFDVGNENLYNSMKSTLQESCQCIFEFDTYGRKINVRSASANPATKPAYFSFNNLLKDVESAEDSENIATCLSVSGTEGVDIRSVNPMGTNKIYDFSYFMNESNFAPAFIKKHNSWKAAVDNNQLPCYNLADEHTLKTTEVATQNEALADLKGELKDLENQQAVIIQAIAQGLKTQSDLTVANQRVTTKSA